MPFVVKDPLQHKRNNRQVREIHEREYYKYLTNLRQQPTRSYSNEYYLSPVYVLEVERSRFRNLIEKQNQTRRLETQNNLINERLAKARNRSMIDDKNTTYKRNLYFFSCKHLQQRINEYKRIHQDNQELIHRIINVPSRVTSKEQLDDDWRKKVDFIKKSCDYPENVDKFVSRQISYQSKQGCPYNKMKSTQQNNPYFTPQISTRLTTTSFSNLIDQT